MYPLMLTVEHEPGNLFSNEVSGEVGRAPAAGFAILKLNGTEIKRIPLDHYHKTDEREQLELAVSDLFARLLGD